MPEVESRTQGSRPRPRTQQKNPRQGQGHKKIGGQDQEQPFRGLTLSRPRTGMLEAKDQGHRRERSPTKGLQTNFSGDLQNFNDSKYSAVLEPRTTQFSRT